MNNNLPIELRSDTFTKPSKAMREFIANAEVGDDVFSEDPTVNLLEKEVAELLGKEKALYTPTGSMANQCAIKAHTSPGDEVLGGDRAHFVTFEAGAPAVLANVIVRTIPSADSILTSDLVEENIRQETLHTPGTKLVCLENTHNRAGGVIHPLNDILKIREILNQSENKINFHLDGARLWNAAVATGIELKKWAEPFDSVSVCFSKGLGAPVGSAILGTAEFIEKCRRYRKMFGGGMRQAGIIAAGALFALRNNRERLVDDHRRAKEFAEAINKLPYFKINLDHVQTNIIIFEKQPDVNLTDETIVEKFAEAGILLLNSGRNSFRAVYHLNVTEEDHQRALRILGIWEL
jgi:threonine aldolase